MANLSLRLRLVALALSIAALAGVIIGAAAATEKQVATLRNHLTSVRNESFRIADQLESGILSLNATLLRFVLGRDPADWQRFSATENASQAWITKQHPSTSRELQELAQVRSELAAYEAKAKSIAANDSMDRNNPLAVLSEIENASKNILNLGYNLATAHRAAIAQLVDESQKSLTVMQLAITGALALLLAIGL